MLLLMRLGFAVAAAVSGVTVAVSMKRISHLGLCVLISFAAGTLVAVACFHMVPEAIELSGPIMAAGGFLSGYLVFALISRFVFHLCPACSATHKEVNFKALTWTMVLALAFHSFADGFAVTLGGISAAGVGLAVMLAVACHKFPEGMALGLVAMGSGIGRARAFALAAGLETVTTFAGGAAAMAFGSAVHPSWVGLALAHIAGGFVFIVFHALLAEIIKHHPRSTIAAAVSGALLMIAANLFLGHAHG